MGENTQFELVFRSVYLEGAVEGGEHLVETLKVSSCALLGIQVMGRSSVIRNNLVSNIGSTTGISTVRYGIFAEGLMMRVTDNDVSGVNPSNNSGLAYGILAIHSENSLVDRNNVRSDSVRGSQSFGIFVDNSPASLVLANRVTSYYGGIVITASLGTKYRDNITTNVTGAYQGVTDAGNND